VQQRLTLNLDDLYKMRSHTQVVTLEGAGNNCVAFDPQVSGQQWRLGAVSTAEWTGVPGRQLRHPGLQAGAARITSMHHGACREALFQQLDCNRAADPARGSGYQHTSICHRIFLPSLNMANTDRGTLGCPLEFLW
jgi:hypothetical protein